MTNFAEKRRAKEDEVRTQYADEWVAWSVDGEVLGHSKDLAKLMKDVGEHKQFDSVEKIDDATDVYV